MLNPRENNPTRYLVIQEFFNNLVTSSYSASKVTSFWNNLVTSTQLVK